MAFRLLVPDRLGPHPHPHPASLLEEEEARLPPPPPRSPPPFPARTEPLSHHPLSRSVTIVSPRLSTPAALPLPGPASASSGGRCCCRRRRFPPPGFLALLLLPPPSSSSPALPMPPIPCTNFSVSHSFAGMVTGLANLRKTVDSAKETATLPESIPRFDNLHGGRTIEKAHKKLDTHRKATAEPESRSQHKAAAPYRTNVACVVPRWKRKKKY